MNPESSQTGPESRPTSPAAKPSGLTNPEQWVEAHADALFGFAMLRVRDRSTAQDLVQETFLAALRAEGRFAGRSSERAWLFGILRNKLADYYRRKGRDVPPEEGESLGPDEGRFFHSAGGKKDAWVEGRAPRQWADPEESLMQKEFQTVLLACLAKLPDKVAQVFVLREVDGLASAQICKDLNLSANNFWVISHRARMALRRCLELHWFTGKKLGD